MSNKSPLPKKGKLTKLLSFTEILAKVLEGKRATRLEWANDQEYMFIKDSFLSIHTRGNDHTFLLRDADMLALDWIELPTLN